MRERAPRRVLTPPTYAQRGSPTYETYNKPEQRYGSTDVWESEYPITPCTKLFDAFVQIPPLLQGEDFFNFHENFLQNVFVR